jgi:hypothetical protein
VSTNVAFLPGTCCEICSATVGDRILEGLLVCESCAEALATPAPEITLASDERREGPSLEQMVDALLARPVP